MYTLDQQMEFIAESILKDGDSFTQLDISGMRKADQLALGVIQKAEPKLKGVELVYSRGRILKVVK